MKKLIKYMLIFFLFVFAGAGTVAYVFWKDTRMSSNEVKKKWGDQLADINKFKNSSYEEKAKMAYSIMTDKKIIGMTYEQVRETFGPNDGYYFTDTVPAYIVQHGKSHAEDTWQLVFKMDKNDQVRSVIMHKNCCDR